MSLRRIALAVCASTTVCVAAAQSPKPSYEVATVKRNLTTDVNADVEFTPSGGFRARGASVFVLVAMAYSESTYALRPWQVVGGPRWLMSERYDVSRNASSQTPLDDSNRLTTARLRLQALLEDRFKLRVHRDRRDRPVYALVRRAGGALGPSMTRSSIDCDRESGRCGRLEGGPAGRLYSDAMTSALLSAVLANVTGRDVLDRTRLDGWWRVDLEWSSDQTASDKPAIFAAVQEQLGLRLESTRAPVDVVVIDHVDHPSPD